MKRMIAVFVLVVTLFTSVQGFAAANGEVMTAVKSPPPDEAVTASPQKTADPAEDTTFVPKEEPTAPAVEPTYAPPVIADPSALSPSEFIDCIKVSFESGEAEINPDVSSTRLTATITGVPETRRGWARWVIDGVAREDYVNLDFEISEGKTSTFVISENFNRDTLSRSSTVRLEVYIDCYMTYAEREVLIKNYSAEYWDEADVYTVFQKVQPLEIEAWAAGDVSIYSDKYLSNKVGYISSGRRVIYIDHFGAASRKIYIPEENMICWVSYYAINISNKNYVEGGDFTNEEKQVFVNAKGYTSETDTLVWVNLKHQMVNVFKNKDGKWHIEGALPCASGANDSPTPTDIYTYSYYLPSGWTTSTYTVKPVLYINTSRGIAFHSVLYYPGTITVSDGTIGKTVSHGCIRMLTDGIRWMANNVPVGSTVVVF